MKVRASNGELECRDGQRREELKTLIDKANSLGLDVSAKLIEAHELYKSQDTDSNRASVDKHIRSELDCTIAVLKTAIRLKALNRQTDPMPPGDGREKGED